MSGFPARVGVAALLCFVALLHGSDLGYAGGAMETSEEGPGAASKYLLGSGQMSSGSRGDVGGWDDPRFSCRKKTARCLGSRLSPSPPAPTTNRVKSMIYIAPPPPEDQLV